MAFRSNTVMSTCEYMSMQQVEERVYSKWGMGVKSFWAWYLCLILSLNISICSWDYSLLILPVEISALIFFPKIIWEIFYYSIFCTLNLIRFRLSLSTRKKCFFVFSAANLLVDLTHTCKPMRFVTCTLEPWGFKKINNQSGRWFVYLSRLWGE